MSTGADLDRLISASLPPPPSGGVVRVERGGELLSARAWGEADRRHHVAMRPESRLAMASGSKGFTALAVMSLIADGVLSLDTTARSVLGSDLPLVAEDVTVEHLLSHRSGVGDYIDDDADDAEYLLTVPVHTLLRAESYLPLLERIEPTFDAGTDFAYCNAGFIIAAVVAERASGVPFHRLVTERVFEPAGMVDTAYLRSDALPGDAAVGYLERDGRWVTNVHHLPIVGGGDGGAYTTTADLSRFWDALHDGRIVPAAMVVDLATPRSQPAGDDAYGLGFWLRPRSDTIYLEGMDAGVSMRSGRVRETGVTFSVLATTAHAAWPVARAIEGWAGAT